MPSKIQKVPRGFLSALGIKSLGKNPDVLPDELRATFRTDEFYNTDFLQIATDVELAVAPTAGLVTAEVQVPDDEVWVVYNMGCRASLDGATAPGTIDIVPVILDPNNLLTRVGPQIHNISGLDQGDNLATGVNFSPPWVFGPGWQFATQINDFTSGDAWNMLTSVLKASYPA